MSQRNGYPSKKQLVRLRPLALVFFRESPAKFGAYFLHTGQGLAEFKVGSRAALADTRSLAARLRLGEFAHD